MNGKGFNKVNKVINEVSGLDAYIMDLVPVESGRSSFGHNGGANFTVLLPNDALTKFVVRYHEKDNSFTVEVSKYNKFNLNYDNAVMDELMLLTLFKSVYEEISLLNNMMLDKLDFELTKSGKENLSLLKDLDKGF